MALVALYEATFDPRWLDAARTIADVILDKFADTESGGFFDTASDHERLVTRPKDIFDNATPSGTLGGGRHARPRLALLTGDERYRAGGRGRPDGARHDRRAAPDQLRAAALRARLRARAARARSPSSGRSTPRRRGRCGGRCSGGSCRIGWWRAARVRSTEAAIPLLEDRPLRDGKPTAYVCEGYVCQAPVTSAGGAGRRSSTLRPVSAARVEELRRSLDVLPLAP